MKSEPTHANNDYAGDCLGGRFNAPQNPQELFFSPKVHIVLIDFADFRQVTGDKQARAAFDVGWAVLHEWTMWWRTLKIRRTTFPETARHILIKTRRELGLPIRNSYFFSFLPVRNDGNLISRFVRLGFEEDNGPASKRKRYWLVWDATLVGGLTPDAESARASRDIF